MFNFCLRSIYFTALSLVPRIVLGIEWAVNSKSTIEWICKTPTCNRSSVNSTTVPASAWALVSHRLSFASQLSHLPRWGWNEHWDSAFSGSSFLKEQHYSTGSCLMVQVTSSSHMVQQLLRKEAVRAQGSLQSILWKESEQQWEQYLVIDTLWTNSEN